MEINATIFGQMITFGLFVWFTMRYVWPPVQKALDERQGRITEGLAQAEKGRRSLEEAALTIAEELKQSKDKAHAIIEEAHKRAAGIIEDAKRQAREEQQREIARASAEISQLSYAARETLRGEVANLVLVGAEKVLAREIDPAKHDALLREMTEAL